MSWLWKWLWKEQSLCKWISLMLFCHFDKIQFYIYSVYTCEIPKKRVKSCLCLFSFIHKAPEDWAPCDVTECKDTSIIPKEWWQQPPCQVSVPQRETTLKPPCIRPIPKLWKLQQRFCFRWTTIRMFTRGCKKRFFQMSREETTLLHASSHGQLWFLPLYSKPWHPPVCSCLQPKLNSLQPLTQRSRWPLLSLASETTVTLLDQAVKRHRPPL